MWTSWFEHSVPIILMVVALWYQPGKDTALSFPSVCMILSVTLHRYIQNSTNRIYVVYVACWTLKNKTSSHSGKHTRCFSPFNHTESALPIFRAGIIINFILLFIIIPSAIQDTRASWHDESVVFSFLKQKTNDTPAHCNMTVFRAKTAFR